MRIGIVSVVAAALACAGASTAADRTHSAAAVLYVEVSAGRGRSAPPTYELCAVPGAGAQPAVVTPGGADQEPAVSASGEVAFVRGQFGAGRLHRTSGGGAPAAVVREDMIAYWPSWTPDGTRIAFASPGPGAALVQGLDVWTVAPDGSDLRRVTSDPMRDTMPAVSPRGRLVAFVRGTNDLGGGELWLADLDGSGERRAAGLSGVTRPAWSPNGAELVFSAGGTIWRVPADGSAPAVPLGAGSEPAYAPDGSAIAFVRDDDVWAMRPDGTEARNVTHSPIAEREPAWLRGGRPAGSAEPCAIVGTDGNDTLVGTEGDDVFYDVGGNDVIDGRGGNDLIFDGPGDDQLWGGGGNDEIVLQQGANRVLGGDGDDLLTAQRSVAVADPQVLLGEGGNDGLYGGIADDRLLGGPGEDVVFGGRGRDMAAGGPGRDRIEGNAGNDVADGGPGDDTLYGGVRYTGPNGILNGDDVLTGGEGADVLAGGPGLDDLIGGPGPDQLLGGGGADRLRGDGGLDILDGATGDDVLLGRDREPDELRGGPGLDSGRADRGLDVILGLERLLS